MLARPDSTRPSIVSSPSQHKMNIIFHLLYIKLIQELSQPWRIRKQYNYFKYLSQHTLLERTLPKNWKSPNLSNSHQPGGYVMKMQLILSLRPPPQQLQPLRHRDMKRQFAINISGRFAGYRSAKGSENGKLLEINVIRRHLHSRLSVRPAEFCRCTGYRHPAAWHGADSSFHGNHEISIGARRIPRDIGELPFHRRVCCRTLPLAGKTCRTHKEK